MAIDKNGVTIKKGDMLKFKEDRYTTVLGIVENFSIVSDDAVFVALCGGGGTGNRMINASKSTIVTKIGD